MSLFCKSKSRMDYSQRQFIKRKTGSPAPHPNAPLVLGVPNEAIARRKNRIDKLAGTVSVLSATKPKEKCLLLRKERKSTPSVKTIDTDTSVFSYQVKHYQQKVAQLSQLVKEKDSEIRKLKRTIRDMEESNKKTQEGRPFRSASVFLNASMVQKLSSPTRYSGMYRKMRSTGSLAGGMNFRSMDSVSTPRDKEKSRSVERSVPQKNGEELIQKTNFKTELNLIKDKVESKLAHARLVIRKLLAVAKVVDPSMELQ